MEQRVQQSAQPAHGAGGVCLAFRMAITAVNQVTHHRARAFPALTACTDHTLKKSLRQSVHGPSPVKVNGTLRVCEVYATVAYSRASQELANPRTQAPVDI